MDGILLLKVYFGMLQLGLRKMMEKTLKLRVNMSPKVMLLNKVLLNSLLDNWELKDVLIKRMNLQKILPYVLFLLLLHAKWDQLLSANQTKPVNQMKFAYTVKVLQTSYLRTLQVL